MINWLKRWLLALATRHYIQVYDNCFGDELCDMLGKWAGENPENWELVDRGAGLVAIQGISPETTPELDNKVFETLQVVIKPYSESYEDFQVTHDKGYMVFDLKPGDYINKHYTPCKFRVIMMFSDKADRYSLDGSLWFPKQRKIIEQRKGRIIVFPSNFLFPVALLECKGYYRNITINLD